MRAPSLILALGLALAGCAGPSTTSSAPAAATPAPAEARFDLPRSVLDQLIAGYFDDGGVAAQDVEGGIRVGNLPPVVTALGLHDGDVLAELNGLVIGTGNNLRAIHDRLIGAEHLYLVVVRDGAPLLLQYTLRGDGLAFQPPPPLPPTAEELDAEQLAALLDQGITRHGEHTFTIERALIDRLLEHPLAIAKGARVTPSIKNGKPNGIKLYAIRPSSIYAKLGLGNGDTVHSINGFELRSLDDGLEVYQKVRDADVLHLSITRRGKPVELTYTIK